MPILTPLPSPTAPSCFADQDKPNGKIANDIIAADANPRPGGMATRTALALTLTALGTLTPILIEASRGGLRGAPPYAPEQVVCCAEAVKALLCAAAAATNGTTRTTNGVIVATSSPITDDRGGRKRLRSAAKIGALAAIYAAHNNLLIYAVRIVGIATFQVWFTWRVPATAFALWFLAGKTFKDKQMVALAMLMVGTILTQWNGHQPQRTAPSHGLSMVALLVGTSSIASVWNEVMLKDEGMGTLPVQNMQLYCFGFLINLGVMWSRGDSHNDPWTAMLAWPALTWATVFSMAFLGIATSATLKYADNIVRAFAAAGSIVLATVMSMIVFGEALGAFFVLGSTLTCLSAALYFL